MNRDMVIQNIMLNYGQYVAKEQLESMIDSGVAEGLTYELIYLTLKAEHQSNRLISWIRE